MHEAQQPSSHPPETAPHDSQRDAAMRIVRRLREAGHVAYFAGGCVRDRLLGKAPKDYDVATDARPSVVKQLFTGSRAVGEAFGVILVNMHVPHTGEPSPDERRRNLRVAVEVATFRREAGYSDHRRPDAVVFTDAEEDARRRDFTINGLFEDPLSDPPAIIDHVGGREDLEAGIVRAIGDPSERFAEDYLRMLRAVRFAARLGFELEERTASAIRPLSKYLGGMARERIGDEVQRIVMGANPVAGVELLQQLRLDGPTLNEALLTRDAQTLQRLVDQHPDAPYPARLLAWMIDRHTDEPTLEAVTQLAEGEGPRVLKKWRGALCLTNDVRDAMQKALGLLARSAQWDDLRDAHRKRLLAEDAWPVADALLDALPRHDAIHAIRDTAPDLASDDLAPAALINGTDLIAIGLSPGPYFKVLLDTAYDLQLEGELTSREAALQWLDEQPH